MGGCATLMVASEVTSENIEQSRGGYATLMVAPEVTSENIEQSRGAMRL